MTNWSKTRFDLIEARNPGGVETIQGRFARDVLEFEHIGASRFTFEPDARFPFAHRHREQEEAYVVVAGSGRVELDGQTVDAVSGDVFRVSAETSRRFESGPEGMELICVGGPAPDGGKDGEKVGDGPPLA